MDDESTPPAGSGSPKQLEEREYRRSLERSMTSIEEHVAELAGSMEKIRATNHNIVGKVMLLDDVSSQLAVVTSIAKTQTELVRVIGRLGDRLDEVAAKWESDSADFRRRIGALEVGKRV